MEIEERRVLRRKVPLLEAYLKINSSTLKSLRDQGLIDKDQSKAILKLKARRERIDYLLQILDDNATSTTFDKICYYLEKEFLDVIADEMQVELLLEKGKLPLAEYAVKEAKLLAYKLVADYEQLAEEDLENIASVLAGRYVIARETAKRQKARTVKEEDQDMKSIEKDVTKMYEDLQGLFNPMLGGFGFDGDMGQEDSGLGFGDGFGGFNDTGDQSGDEPRIVVTRTGSEPEGSGRSAMQENGLTVHDDRSLTSSAYSMGENIDAESSPGLYPNRDADGRTTREGFSPIQEETQAENTAQGTQADPKEQKKSFMKMLNERMKTLSDHLQSAVKGHHKLLRERNACFDLLGLKPPQEGNAEEEVHLDDELRKILEETGYNLNTDKNDENDEESAYRHKERYSEGRQENNGDYEVKEDEDGDVTELKDKLLVERQKVDKLEEEVNYYKDQIEQMSKTRQMGYFYLSWYDELGLNSERVRSAKPPIGMRKCESTGAITGRDSPKIQPGRPASTGHSTASARPGRGRTRWVYYNPDFLEVGDGYVTLKTDHLPHAWSREATPSDQRPPSGSAQGQFSRSSNPTPGQGKRFNSPDFKLPPPGKNSGLTQNSGVSGYNDDLNHQKNTGYKNNKSVRISSGKNKVYNGMDSDSLEGSYD